MSRLAAEVFAALGVAGLSALAPARPQEPAAPATSASSRPASSRPASSRPSVPDWPAHLRELQSKLPDPSFTIVKQPPFAVVGDEPPDIVRQRAKQIVKWAVDLLEHDYFAHAPDHIIDIWLFKDAASYRNHGKQLFGAEPSTPFGYYSATHRALVMNIATGGGTLVHEIVHPYVRANFPDCPAWFNEGLGSLYEQSKERDGHIVGLTNWRLAGLQKAIRARTLPTFAKLTATTDEEFYGEDRGTNYAQARYLLYFLQEKGLLQRYWRELTAHHADDPTGYAMLRAVLKRDDMGAFQSEWEAFVLALRFP